ncbi:GNAT family N-acetyltransferase [Putridiphycobacter roseus]|uniref:GNAT family N-acetyltransferase n=1 Tax=Putridiphycobacter roseus TaxID=2219161 RepID=A0A2W1N0D1_9FLAO|nr:GNAT family N-acetyltransferase [Putridiphycobacter roseus]PZE17667.1 GNAT family N-acetyltransferase [Putridiphycobacter roseus]
MNVIITLADKRHFHHAETICNMMSEAALVRGTGIAKRQPEYIQKKMEEGKAILALDKDIPVGFCYIESWENEKYVANSGLITHVNYRNTGLAKAIKKATFDLSKQKYPNAKLFGITTSMAVMKINSNLGYKPVTFSELTQDEKFWDGCNSCHNYDILQRTNKTMCICTGMVCDLKAIPAKGKVHHIGKTHTWNKFTKFLKLRKIRIQKKAKQFPKLNNFINNEK